jgi:two-component system sensor histidine kinase RegB
MNPFTSLYFLEVALAAILVPRRWSLVVTICAVGFFGALLLARPEAIHVWHSAEMFMLHVRGMWVSFALTAACLWVFIERVSASLRHREDELAAARIAAERAARLNALGTLAAGTAHELNTPLGTVAILAAELSELLSTNPAARDHADRIRTEIRRCKEILARLRTRTPNDDERHPTPMVPWVEATVLDWCAAGEERRAVVHATERARTAVHTIHVEGLRFALLNLLDNASIAAQSSVSALVVEVTLDDDTLAITVVDHGVGISTEHLDRLGEPFFTTREPGQGMGLGLFLVQAIASQHGGRMRAQSHDGVTRVGVELPAR